MPVQSNARRRISAARRARACLGRVIDTLESRLLLTFVMEFNGQNLGGGGARVAFDIDVGDINSDGIPDAVNTNTPGTGHNEVNVWFGTNGRGAFQQQPSLDGTIGRGAVRLGDLNNDGLLDLVSTGRDDGTLRARLNLGGGTFGQELLSIVTSQPTGQQLDHLELADMNGDGRLDAVVGNRVGDLRILSGNGDGTFASPAWFSFPGFTVTSLNVLDIDNDGAPDVVYTTTAASADIIRITNLRTTPTPTGTLFNGGLEPDTTLTVANAGGTLGNVFAIVERPAGGAAGQLVYGRNILSPTNVITVTPLRANYGRPAIADLNADGIADLAVTYGPQNALGTLKIQAGSATGAPFVPVDNVLDAGWTIAGVRAFQLNTDGNADLLIRSLGSGGGYDDFSVVINNQQSLVVSTTADENDGFASWNIGTGASLREVMNYAISLGGPRTITFAPFLGNADAVINVTAGPIVAQLDTADITVANTRGRVFIDGNNTASTLVVAGGAAVTLRDLTFRNFRPGVPFSIDGGAVFVASNSRLTVDRVTFTRNAAAGFGSAIYADNPASVVIRNSTFSGNTGDGAIAVRTSAPGNARLEHNTLAGNTTGLRVLAGTVILQNNIIAGNGTADIAVTAGAVTGSGNLVRTGVTTGLSGTINADPLLASLGNYGGPTLTMRLREGSPAINAATALAGVLVDQRGVPRPQFAAPDIGAVEFRTLDIGVVTADGAFWFLGSGSGDRPIFRQAPGQAAQIIPGLASSIGLTRDGDVVVRNQAGAVSVRRGSASGTGFDWLSAPTAVAADGATWFNDLNTGIDGDIFRWDATGLPEFSGGRAQRIASANGTIIVLSQFGEMFLRVGSNTGLGSAWVVPSYTFQWNPGGPATDYWLILADAAGTEGPILRWNTGSTLAQDSGGSGRELAQEPGRTILTRKTNGEVYARVGSANGLGSTWELLRRARAGDNADWFIGSEGAGPDRAIYRWPANGSPADTGGVGVRVGALLGGSIVSRSSNGIIRGREGSNAGLGNDWETLDSVVAGDGARWFTGVESAQPSPNRDIYRWGAAGTPEFTDGGGVSLTTTPAGDVRTTNAAAERYHRVGSSAGIGTEWRLLIESLIVTTALDENDFTSSANLGTGTSLREALAYANDFPGPNTITFAAGLAGQTITLGFGWSGETDDTALRAVGDLTIDGGSGLTLAIAGGTQRRILAATGDTLDLRNLTLRDGDLPAGAYGGALWLDNGALLVDNVQFINNRAGLGGAIFGVANVTATITDSRFEGNDSNGGGAIHSSGTLSVVNSTFVNNASSLDGGALTILGTATIDRSTLNGNTVGNDGGAMISFGNLTVINSTFADNGRNALALSAGNADLRYVTVAYNRNGGVVITGAAATLRNTLVAGNSGFDLSGPLTATSSNNLLNRSAADARIGPLADNGGTTMTILPLPGSPAVNNGINLPGIIFDQRGVSRPAASNTAVDIGAVEREATTASLASAAFEYETRQAYVFDFDGEATANFGRTSYTIRNLTTNQNLPSSTGTLTWNSTGTQVILDLFDLPDADYELDSLAGVQHFHVLRGDANRDRIVNIGDFSILASRFNLPGTFSQGDFNYSGLVEIGDFSILASKFNLALPASTAAPARAPAAAVAPAAAGGGRFSGRVLDMVADLPAA